MRRYDGDWGESGERPPYWNIRLREVNSSSGRERERERQRLAKWSSSNQRILL